MLRAMSFGGALPATTWANVGSAATAGSGTMRFVTDLGENGTVVVSNGTRWRALNGAAALKTLGNQTGNIANSDTIVLQASLPVGAWQVNDNIRIYVSMTKSGSTDAGSMIVRVGTAGTTADTAILTLTGGTPVMAASNLTAGFIYEFKLASVTTSLKVGTQFAASGYAGASNSAIQAPVTISDASANALFVSVGIASAGATNTVNLQSGQIQLITP